MRSPSLGQLLRGIRAQDERTLAHAISLVEDRSPVARSLLQRLAPRVGQAHRIGITGPPGVGKSTLIASLAPHLLRRGKRLTIIAVDPTSPLTGGAFLGDRLRMQSLVTHPRIFIRSMATRGATTSLAPTTKRVADLCDTSGANPILLETVGAGQAEIGVARLVHTIVLVLMPGVGDTMQLLKAGILELAHVIVVNKADHRGAQGLVQELHRVCRVREQTAWPIPILATVAERGHGVSDVASAIHRHQQWLTQRRGTRR